MAKLKYYNSVTNNYPKWCLAPFGKLMGDKVVFSKAVQGGYPILMVYKMTENNEFKYAKPRDYYYTTWEAINKGEGDLPEGSGGETVSVNTFVIMMLMNYKIN